jgi:glycosyltransferase involved in cell wall biosynthesis
MNRAGMENRLLDLYRNIDRNELQFDFYTFRMSEGVHDSEITNRGGKVYYSRPISIARVPFIIFEVQRFLRKHPEYQIVHCHLNQWSGFVLLGAMIAGVKTRIAHSRTSLEETNTKNFVKNAIKGLVNLTATHRFAVSKKAGEWLFGKKRVHKGDVWIWPNAIDVRNYVFSNTNRESKRIELGITDAFTLINVGNIRLEKNHMYLLDIFTQLKKNRENIKLLIVGNDHLEGSVHKKAIELEIDKDVLFLGSRDDVSELLMASDVFVFPSLYEGFPGSVLEAEATGLPCLISDTITTEVGLTKYVYYLSINVEPKKWVDKLMCVEKLNIDRVEEGKIIAISGYDIQSIAKELSDFYLERTISL